ncbi:Malate dehydrogenase, cytoplasmic [Tetrabaena socialis]|uniref:Malate dehydrogenase, cytoplasmic n=1 Tax=Tetrabaena socialis TaxID=47790 RepID=A0A2J7ZIB5_9CHLO|nr:Malate dehydrogenase, cytoplasmic [Tetrabaena socialis]|eukprot:PNH00012.1 Malate dehydrogenase, cytoplasmic [Tetrabaena socialis]
MLETARGLSSALSAANAVCNHVRDWVLGTPYGSWVSMGVVSVGAYGVQPGLVYSYPVTCSGGKWSVVKGLPIDEASRERLRVTEAELVEERDLAMTCLAERK